MRRLPWEEWGRWKRRMLRDEGMALGSQNFWLLGPRRYNCVIARPRLASGRACGQQLRRNAIREQTHPHRHQKRSGSSSATAGHPAGYSDFFPCFLKHYSFEEGQTQQEMALVAGNIWLFYGLKKTWHFPNDCRVLYWNLIKCQRVQMCWIVRNINMDTFFIIVIYNNENDSQSSTKQKKRLLPALLSASG